MIDVLTRPGDERAAGALLAAALGKKGGQGALLCLVPEYQWWLQPRLETLGFRAAGLFNVYAREVMARARKARLLPVGA